MEKLVLVHVLASVPVRLMLSSLKMCMLDLKFIIIRYKYSSDTARYVNSSHIYGDFLLDNIITSYWKHSNAL